VPTVAEFTQMLYGYVVLIGITGSFGLVAYFKVIEWTERRWRAFVSKRTTLAISCEKCGKLAAPMLRTKNRYRCPCGNQFAGDPHNIRVPKGQPHWLTKDVESYSPFLIPGNRYYDGEMDPLSDSFDPQKKLEDTRFWQSLSDNKT
jgi:hypothetical protein